MAVYLGEAEWYCEKCAPEGAEDYLDCGEVDCPQHCSTCHVPLDYTLTRDGVTYVLEALQQELDKWEENPDKARREWEAIHECYTGTWYEGSPHVTITRDWAEEVKRYCGFAEDECLIDKFLTVTLCAVRSKPFLNVATHNDLWDRLERLKEDNDNEGGSHDIERTIEALQTRVDYLAGKGI